MKYALVISSCLLFEEIFAIDEHVPKLRSKLDRHRTAAHAHRSASGAAAAAALAGAAALGAGMSQMATAGSAHLGSEIFFECPVSIYAVNTSSFDNTTGKRLWELKELEIRTWEGGWDQKSYEDRHGDDIVQLVGAQEFFDPADLAKYFQELGELVTSFQDDKLILSISSGHNSRGTMDYDCVDKIVFENINSIFTTAIPKMGIVVRSLGETPWSDGSDSDSSRRRASSTSSRRRSDDGGGGGDNTSDPLGFGYGDDGGDADAFGLGYGGDDDDFNFDDFDGDFNFDDWRRRLRTQTGQVKLWILNPGEWFGPFAETEADDNPNAVNLNAQHLPPDLTGISFEASKAKPCEEDDAPLCGIKAFHNGEHLKSVTQLDFSLQDMRSINCQDLPSNIARISFSQNNKFKLASFTDSCFTDRQHLLNAGSVVNLCTAVTQDMIDDEKIDQADQALLCGLFQGVPCQPLYDADHSHGFKQSICHKCHSGPAGSCPSAQEWLQCVQDKGLMKDSAGVVIRNKVCNGNPENMVVVHTSNHTNSTTTNGTAER